MCLLRPDSHDVLLFPQEDATTQDQFRKLSIKANTTQLKDRYYTLKAWLRTAERRSAIASGVQEEDGVLRRLIEDVKVAEEVCTV